ncbi:MAG: hypothetical protein NT098_04615 [Candidatus Parcubacteria bacterium]|nr:hypothetical protein [Candidatus Parcubacteria bacterium]
MNKPIPKFYPEKTDDDIFVEVSLPGTEDCPIYTCVGILAKESDEMIRVGFSKSNGRVDDYQDIKIADILDIKVVDPDEIQIIR